MLYQNHFLWSAQTLNKRKLLNIKQTRTVGFKNKYLLLCALSNCNLYWTSYCLSWPQFWLANTVNPSALSSIFRDGIIRFTSVDFRSANTGWSYDLANEQERHKHVPQSYAPSQLSGCRRQLFYTSFLVNVGQTTSKYLHWDRSCPGMHKTFSFLYTYRTKCCTLDSSKKKTCT